MAVINGAVIVAGNTGDVGGTISGVGNIRLLQRDAGHAAALPNGAEQGKLHRAGVGNAFHRAAVADEGAGVGLVRETIRNDQIAVGTLVGQRPELGEVDDRAFLHNGIGTIVFVHFDQLHEGNPVRGVLNMVCAVSTLGQRVEVGIGVLGFAIGS